MVLAAMRRRHEAWGFNPRQMSAIILEALLGAQVSSRLPLNPGLHREVHRRSFGA